MQQNMRGRCFEAEDVGPGQATDIVVALDLITTMVQDRYQTDPTQHAPMIFAFSEGAVATIFQLDFADTYTKDASISTAARHLKELGCDASVFVSEGWGVKQPHTSIIQRPSTSPHRVEMLMFEASARGRHVSTIYEMVRDGQGRFLAFKPYNRVDEQADTSGITVRSKFDFFN